MGLINWLFGRGDRETRSSKEIVDPKPQPGRFGKDRHATPGAWVQTTMMIKVKGIQHRGSAVGAFATAVQAAERHRAYYGVTLKPEPGNSHDKNAIAVYGIASGAEWHLGYLDAYTAEEINRDLVSKGIPIAAELYEIWVSDEGFIDVKIIVLAPPGYGHKARVKARRSS
jgi:hypothetical protein